MKLNQKIDSVIMRHDLMRNETEETIGQLELIADNYAINFAQFITGITHKLVDGYFYFYYESEWKTTKELLEIYKKQAE